MFHDELVSGHAIAGHHHDEGDTGIGGGHHGRDDSALAVADEADLARVGLGTRLQIGHARFGVAGKVGGSGLGEVSRGLAYAALVGPQHHNALTGEIIRQHQKRFMAHKAFVAVVLARATDQQNCGKRPLARWNGQRAGQRVACGLIGISHVFFAIRVGLDGILRASPRLHCGLILDSLQRQRQGRAHLRECAIHGA